METIDQTFYKSLEERIEKVGPQGPGFAHTSGSPYGDWDTSQKFRVRKAKRRAQSKNARAARRRNRSTK